MTNNPEFEGKVNGRMFKFPVVDGLTELEMSGIIKQLDETVKRIEGKTHIPDTGKLSVLAAFEFAVELNNLKQRSETNREADTKKLDDMVERLEKTLEEDGKP